MYKKLSELYEYTQFRSRKTDHRFRSLYGKDSSVTGQNVRKKEADKQKNLAIEQNKEKKESVINVIRLTKEFLAKIEVEGIYYNDSAVVEIDKEMINGVNKFVMLKYDDIAYKC